MKAIYYAGLVVGIEALVRASRAAIPPSAGHVRTRDADAWLQQPQQGIEKFDAVVIPEGEQYDALAEAYASADAHVVRGGPEASARWLEKPVDEGPPPPPPPPEPPEPPEPPKGKGKKGGE